MQQRTTNTQKHTNSQIHTSILTNTHKTKPKHEPHQAKDPCSGKLYRPVFFEDNEADTVDLVGNFTGLAVAKSLLQDPKASLFRTHSLTHLLTQLFTTHALWYLHIQLLTYLHT